MKKYKFFFILIILLGFILRFYKLGGVPVGFYKDEAFLTYNAYSILNTGKDISGNFLPIHLESFLYSPAGYSYFSIPFIKIFDLSAFSARFASAFFGSLTIISVFFLVLEIFKKYKHRQLLSLFSSFLFAISPWNINLSRTATENVIVVFFITIGIILYLLGVNNKKNYLIFISFIFFFLSIFIYQAPRAFLPFFIPLLIYSFANKEQLKQAKFSIVLFALLVLLPLFIILSSKELSLRVRTVSIFSGGTQLVLDEQIRQDGTSNVQRVITRMLHNKPVIYTSEFFTNYFKHFSYDFLFSDKGLPDRYRIPLSGLLYLFEIPLLIFGIYRLSFFNKIGVFLLGWLIIAPIGSALTFDDVPNLQRTLIIFPSISIVSAFGLVELFAVLKNKKKLFFPITTVLSVIVGFSFFFYIHQYDVHYSIYRPWYRNDGYKDLVLAVNKALPSYEKAIITNRESAPTIFFLFYGKYNPLDFQKETKDSKLRDFDRVGFSKYEFSQEECPVDPLNPKLLKNVLYVNSGLCKDVTGAKIIKKITRSDGSPVFNLISK